MHVMTYIKAKIKKHYVYIAYVGNTTRLSQVPGVNRKRRVYIPECRGWLAPSMNILDF